MANGAPYFYNYMNTLDSPQSGSQIHATNTRTTQFFQKYLLQKAISVFRWSIPEDWARNFLLYCLYCFGFVSVFQTDKFGVIFQPCGLFGYDVYYRPTHAIISNPLLTGIQRPRIGRQCEIIRLQPDYSSIMDIVTHYAELMAIATETAGINLFNSKLSYVFNTSSKSHAETLKNLYDRISSGEPAVILDKSVLNPDGSPCWAPFSQNVGQNYIVDKILGDLRKIEAMFDTDVGIPNANTDKKERLITDEVNSNNIETLSKCSLWLEELKESCAKCNDMFGLSLSVDWRYDVQQTKEVNEYASQIKRAGTAQR